MNTYPKMNEEIKSLLRIGSEQDAPLGFYAAQRIDELEDQLSASEKARGDSEKEIIECRKIKEHKAEQIFALQRVIKKRNSEAAAMREFIQGLELTLKSIDVSGGFQLPLAGQLQQFLRNHTAGTPLLQRLQAAEDVAEAAAEYDTMAYGQHTPEGPRKALDKLHRIIAKYREAQRVVRDV